MTGQWRVIADRDKGDDPSVFDAEPGDLVVYRCGEPDVALELVRIERPVPTTDKRWDKIDALTREWRQAIITDDEYSEAVHALLPPAPHRLTREQISRDELILVIRDVSADHHGNGPLSLSGSEAARIADAVLAFLSQPTPTAATPRIEDMAPGTTFTEVVQWTVHRDACSGLYARRATEHASERYLDGFDPSTIRDVQLPKEGARG